MKLRYLFIFTLSLFSLISPVKAAACDADDLARLKNLAERVDVAYTLVENTDEKDRYNLSINNVESELSLTMINEYNEESTYTYDSKNNGKIEIYDLGPGELKIKVYSINCESNLKTITLNLPYYNKYYENECKDYKDKIKSCQKWSKTEINQARVLNEISQYKSKEEENKTIETLKDMIDEYRLHILIGIVILTIIIITIKIINKKRGELN